MKKLLASLSASLMLASGVASAVVTVFYNEDTSPSATVTAGPAAARAAFLASLASGVSTENFESLSGSAPLSLSFSGSSGTIAATLNGGAIQTGSGAGRFATSGTQYLEADTASFSIDFSVNVAAFGFYGTDIGDFGGDLTVQLFDGATLINTISVGNTNPSPDGSLFFWGVTDSANSFNRIVFQNSNTTDFFGFDDMTIGDLGQVTNGNLPVPGVAWMLLAGLGAVGLARRK